MVIIHVPSFDCPFQNLRPVLKAILLHSTGVWLLVVIVLIYLFFLLLLRKKRCLGTFEVKPVNSGSVGTQIQYTTISSYFTVHVVCAFTYISLLMYSSLVHLCFILLHCVPIGDHRVLFIDGTIQCYQLFQYFLLGYVVFSVLPFCFIPILGAYLLSFQSISIMQFCLGCILPLPFCCYWFCILVKNCGLRCATESFEIQSASEDQSREEIGEDISRRAVQHVLSGPFRTQKPLFGLPWTGIPWEGALIFRRLIIISTLTFTYDNRLRMLITLILGVFILVSHLYVHPFVRAENFFETVSLSSLIVICGLSLIKALNQGEDYSSLSSSMELLNAFDTVENVLIVTPAALVVLILTFSLFFKLILFGNFCVWWLIIGLRPAGRFAYAVIQQ